MRWLLGEMYGNEMYMIFSIVNEGMCSKLPVIDEGQEVIIQKKLVLANEFLR
jgi:hypothetical protein